MSPTPILAETDIGDYIVFIVFAAVALIQWLIGLAKEKMESGRQPRNAPTPEEIDAFVARRIAEGGEVADF